MFVGKLGLVLLSCILGLAGAEGENSHSYLDKCPKFQVRKSTIIKTQQSIHDGAEFLGKKIMTSSRGCHEQCCKKDGCNLVMLKYDTESTKEKVSCFMFNCRSPSVCTFFEHKSYHSYAALEYEDEKAEKPQYSSKDYGKKTDYKGHHKVRETTTEAPYPMTTAEPYKAKNWGNINWFEATTTSKPKYMKPKYDNTGYDSTNSWESGKKNRLDDQDLDKLSTTHRSYNHKTSSDTKNVNPWHNSAPKSTKGYDSSEYGSYDHTQGTKPDARKNPTDKAEKTTAPDEDEDFPRRVFVDNNPDFPDKPHSNPKAPHPTGQKAEVQDEKPKETKPQTTKTARLRTTTDTTELPVTKSHISNVVIKRLNIQENKAVIPLAVGLVLALLLLMGIIFRLKTSRRRRTKAFLTDDADYLINGMYL